MIMQYGGKITILIECQYAKNAIITKGMKQKTEDAKILFGCLN